MSLEGKCAIVTGANSGIGKAIALALAAEGANIVIDYIANPDHATEDLERQIVALGNRAFGVEADVSKVADLQKLIDGALRWFGKVDIMVNNAGVETRTSILDTTEEQYEKVLDINLKKPENAALLDKHFVMVHVNVGDKGVTDNFEVAERFGIPLKKGVPALAVLDSDGRLVYAQKSGEFESMRSMDPRSVNDFLVKWKAPDR